MPPEPQSSEADLELTVIAFELTVVRGPSDQRQPHLDYGQGPADHGHQRLAATVLRWIGVTLHVIPVPLVRTAVMQERPGIAVGQRTLMSAWLVVGGKQVGGKQVPAE